MMRTPTLGQMTYAELCLAIENGEILVVQDGPYYEIKRRDVLRYAYQVAATPDRRTALAS
jgi:hypothetical protein